MVSPGIVLVSWNERRGGARGRGGPARRPAERSGRPRRGGQGGLRAGLDRPRAAPWSKQARSCPRAGAQMAARDEVLRRLRPPDACACPCSSQPQGIRAARAAGAREIAIFTAASETFNREHQRVHRRVFARFAEFVPTRSATAMGRGYVSTCFAVRTRARWTRPGCGRRAPSRRRGCHEISIGDTIGVAVPTQVTDRDGTAEGGRAQGRARRPLPRHRGTALANVLRRCRKASRSWTARRAVSGAVVRAGSQRQPRRRRPHSTCCTGWASPPALDLDKVARPRRALAPRLGHALPSRYLQAGAPAPVAG